METQLRKIKLSTVVVAIGLGIAVAALVEDARIEGQGLCYLFVDSQGATSGSCEYSVAIQSIAVVFAVTVSGYEVMKLFTSKLQSSAVDLIIMCGTCILTLMILVQASLISAGINETCDTLGIKNNCRKFLKDNASDDVVKNMEIAEIISWISCAVWIILTAVTIFSWLKSRIAVDTPAAVVG